MHTAVVFVIELPPLNVTVPSAMYTAPPFPFCTHHPSADGRPRPQVAVRELEGSRRCARVGDRHAVEHERALLHVHRPSGSLHTRGRR